MTAPRATVRLQFHPEFTLDDAVPLVDYFASLGVSHVYASPLTEARDGSTHGYDVIDHGRIRHALGGELALRRLVDRLRAAGMGLILDIVPNHMGTGCANPWWWDVLRWGPESRYAGHFDIDWRAPDPALTGKILAPFLGGAYGAELASGDLRLVFDAPSGAFEIRYHDNRFPVTPASFAGIFASVPGSPTAAGLADTFAALTPGTAWHARQAACTTLRAAAGEPTVRAVIDAALVAHDPAEPAGRERLHQLLERQHYRLTWWRNAAEQINWRRFFEISDLVGVRVEEPEVFADVHALIVRLYAEGIIDGVRIDHVDGLTDPRGYCRALRAALRAVAQERPGELAGDEPVVLVEKILGAHETMPEDWDVDGTSGYDFMAEVGGVLHDAEGEAPLTTLWKSVSGERRDISVLVPEARRMLISRHFAGEHENLARALHGIAQESAQSRDWSLAAIRRTLTELLVAFPVYRTYGGLHGRTDADQVFFREAVEAARARLQADDQVLLDQIDAWLGGETAANHPPGPRRNARLTAIRRFQQLTAPLAAKSLEDTVFFRYGRLLSRNEVGAEPGVFALSVADFHAAGQARAKHWPQAMLATATHDHKRGEDARMRLAVVSEVPEAWRTFAESWMSSAEDAPHPADQYMLLSTLVAAWAPDLGVNDEAGIDALRERVDAWQVKSLREGKLRSTWFAPDTDYEARCSAFLTERLAPGPHRDALYAFVTMIAPAGAIKSLAQTLVRLTFPGVPDLYQGTEFWDFSLTDPDNRRPVDFDARIEALGQPLSGPGALQTWQDGRVKQWLVRRALGLRQREPALFVGGDYVPLVVTGAHADDVIAYARRQGDAIALVIVPRRAAARLGQTGEATASLPLLPAERWADTQIVLPDAWSDITWADALARLDAPAIAATQGRLPLAQVLADFPVALLRRE
ncbi:malto-oligosyltrehalose synthase [Achromobacter sp. GG226]|uniref:malto-oligosyltrehalose synthase n=1 Tax=Verticiella alkaliphila TaxID=2779529 RepID=UPI001C0C2872|nr:malto-oligosyltrehalose synthase [Verticiella sp. GG226]MBU4611830.1 malto-oligosyltrehalose synthase [Verticiella sp. GG226]